MLPLSQQVALPRNVVANWWLEDNFVPTAKTHTRQSSHSVSVARVVEVLVFQYAVSGDVQLLEPPVQALNLLCGEDGSGRELVGLLRRKGAGQVHVFT